MADQTSETIEAERGLGVSDCAEGRVREAWWCAGRWAIQHVLGMAVHGCAMDSGHDGTCRCWCGAES